MPKINKIINTSARKIANKINPTPKSIKHTASPQLQTKGLEQISVQNRAFVQTNFAQKLAQIKRNTKQARELTKDRSLTDKIELHKIISKHSKGASPTQVGELLATIKPFLEATTPDDEFVFACNSALKTSRNRTLEGINEILCAKKKNSRQYEQYLLTLEMIKRGELPSDILATLCKEGRIDRDFLNAVEKKAKGIPDFTKYTDANRALKNTKLGEPVEVDGLMYYKSKGGLKRIHLTPETFQKLFPKLQTMVPVQNNSNDFYVISSIAAIMSNPKTRGNIFDSFKQIGSHVLVTIPDTPKKSIIFKNAQLLNRQKLMNSSLGMQMLESAYYQTRAKKYETLSLYGASEGGRCLPVLSAFLREGGQDIQIAHRFLNYTREGLMAENKCIENTLKPLKEKGFIVSKSRTSRTYIRELDQTRRTNLEILEHYDDLRLISRENFLDRLLECADMENYIATVDTGDLENYPRQLLSNHSYRLKGVDEARKQLIIVNPWNGAQNIRISFEDFEKYFDSFTTFKIK